MLNNLILIEYELIGGSLPKEKWIAEDIKNILFQEKCNITNKKQLHTYFILDTATRKRNMGISDIDSISDQGVTIRCLFNDEDADNYEEAAPYIIGMTIYDTEEIDDSTVSDFHKDFFKDHWGKREGIFIRSYMSIDDLRNHLNSFIKIQDENKKWYFFRFYDPYHFLTCMQMLTSEKVENFFMNDLEILIPKRDKIQSVTLKGNI